MILTYATLYTTEVHVLKALVEVGGAISANLVSFPPLSGEAPHVCFVMGGMGGG